VLHLLPKIGKWRKFYLPEVQEWLWGVLFKEAAGDQEVRDKYFDV